MPTYLDIQNRIATDLLNRNNLNAQIKNGIQTAIRHYQRTGYWFNETSTILTLTVFQEQLATPSDFLCLQELMVTQNSASIQLIPASFDFIRRLNINNTPGLPTRFCEYGENFCVANIPDSAYPVPCYYIQQLPALSADTDTNGWLSAAEDLIVYAAAKYVWAGVIRNMSAANAIAQMETGAALELSRITELRQNRELKPTTF